MPSVCPSLQGLKHKQGRASKRRVLGNKQLYTLNWEDDSDIRLYTEGKGITPLSVLIPGWFLSLLCLVFSWGAAAIYRSSNNYNTPKLEGFWIRNWVKKKKIKQTDYRRRIIGKQIPATLQGSFCLISMKPSTALAPDLILSSLISIDLTTLLWTMWLKVVYSLRSVSRSLNTANIFFFKLEKLGAFRAEDASHLKRRKNGVNWALLNFSQVQLKNLKQAWKKNILFDWVLRMLLWKILLIYSCLQIILVSEMRQLISIFLSACIKWDQF